MKQLEEHEDEGLRHVIDRAQYKKRLLQFLAEHEDHITLHNLHQNEPQTPKFALGAR